MLFSSRLIRFVFTVFPLTFASISLAQPANDNWVDGIVLTAPFTASGDNFAATVEVNEQNLEITTGTVWWYFQAPQTGTVTINTFGSDFDTVLHVYTDFTLGFGNFTLVASNDQFGGTNQSQVTFPVTQGQFYEIRVGGWLGAEGNISLEGLFVAPVNDNWSNTMPVTLPFNASGLNIDATVELNEQNLVSPTTGTTVWWYFQAPESGTVTINTLGSDFDTVLHVYTDFTLGFGNFTLVASSDDFGGTFQSQVTFEVTQGQFYEIRVGGYQGAQGTISMKGFFPPTNDNWVDTTNLPFPLNTTGANLNASVELNEQNLDVTTGTVWWFFQATQTVTVTINTLGSDFDTVLHVYTDWTLGFGNFTLVAENDPFGGTNQSQVTFDVVQGQFYEIRVGGFFGSEGNISLQGFVKGDANGDGGFDFGDIEAFFLALTDPGSFSTMYPNVAPDMALDFDGDGTANFGDIEAFFAALTGG